MPTLQERCDAAEDGQIRLAETITLTATEVAAVQHQVRSRVLRWFVRAGYLDATDALDMAGWEHGGGFSLDASVRSEAPDRAGLERLLRYCARAPFACEHRRSTLDRGRKIRFRGRDQVAACAW